MQTIFKVDAIALTVQEAAKVLDAIDTAIGEIIEGLGFNYMLKASGDTQPIITYMVEDKA